MNKLDVRIVKMEPVRVASIRGFGENPEDEAWQKLETWATPLGLLDDPEAHPIYGFNNPNPSAGSSNYGYELWMVVESDTAPVGEEKIIDFDGGLYAVARCDVPADNFEVIGEIWKQLATWREDSKYGCGSHQWLEKSVRIPQWGNAEPGLAFSMDLYLPIAA